jgi:hypothetical protein
MKLLTTKYNYIHSIGTLCLRLEISSAVHGNRKIVCISYKRGVSFDWRLFLLQEINSSDKIKTMLAFLGNKNKNAVNIFATNGEKILFLND